MLTIGAPQLEAAAAAALPRAAALGLCDEDGQYVHAACERIYGPGYDAARPWAAAVFGPGCAPALRPALLRTRVALDTAAWL